MPEWSISGTNLTCSMVVFDKLGHEAPEPQGNLMSDRLAARIARRDEPITDLFIFSHGWMTDRGEAEASYTAWIQAMASQQADYQAAVGCRPGFKPLLVGIHWPSKPFVDHKGGDGSLAEPEDGPAAEELVEQYTAILEDEALPADRLRGYLRTIILSAYEDPAPPELPANVAQALGDLDALLRQVEAGPDDERAGFNPAEVYNAILDYEDAEDDLGGGGGGSPLIKLLGVGSFWHMKRRAQVVGRTGGQSLLYKLQRARDAWPEARDVAPGTPGLRIHAMGHSFGCIVISSMLAGREDGSLNTAPVGAVMLLLGAMSCWAFCDSIPYLSGRPGRFADIIAAKKIGGPLVIVRSDHDRALSKAYVLAAETLNQIDLADSDVAMVAGPYSALGSRGTQQPGAEPRTMKGSDYDYAFSPGGIYNVDGSDFITVRSPQSRLKAFFDFEGAHNDFAHPEIAHTFWSAILSTATP